MQKIRVTIPKVRSGYYIRELVVDETIGLKAGRDQYATARGTAKTLCTKVNPLSWRWVRLVIDDTICYEINWDSGTKSWDCKRI